MDTQNSAVTDVPNIRLAKVGKDRERKRGGAGWLGARGAGSGFGGAVGGSGAGAGFAGMSAAKVILSLVVAGSVSAGAWQFGRSFSGPSANGKAAARKVFDDKDGGKYADTSNVMKTQTTIPNSLGYVSGSTDGLTPEERAKRAAEAEAARVAADEAAKKDAEEQAKKDQEAASADSKSAVDPATIASTMAGKKPALGEGKFGRLGGFGGGGLSGGSGLSGGINRSFGGNADLGKPKINAGSMSAFRNTGKPGFTSAGRSVAGRSKSKGFAKRQLDNAFAQSRQATSAGKSENAAASAASPFDNNPGQGNVIAGPGLNSGAGAGTADGGTPMNPNAGGGPIDSNAGAACSQGMAPDINGNCQTIQTQAAKDDAQYQWMIQLAQALLVIIGILSLACLVFKGKAWFEAIADAISAIIGALGVVVAGLGLAIMAMTGDKVMGGILTAIGALVAAVAFWPAATTTAPATIEAGAGEPIMMAGDAMESAGSSGLSAVSAMA
jgi:hypothetical protein